MFRKHPLETTDVPVEWYERLAGDTLQSSNFTVSPSGLTITSPSHTADTASAFFSGGVEGQRYRVTNTVTTTGGRTLVTEFTVFVTSVPAVVSLSQIQNDILPGLTFEDKNGRPLSANTMTSRINAVVSQFETKTGIRFQPTRVKQGKLAFPNEVFDEQFDGIDYNWDETLPDQFSSMYLQVKPILEIQAIGIRVIGSSNLRIIPNDWGHPDKNLGHLRIAPGETLTLPPYQSSTSHSPFLRYDQTVPHGWHFLYTAGYTASELEEHPWIGLGMAKLVALEILTPGSIDKFFAKGLSGVNISADGLSQGTSLMQNPNALKYAALAAQLEKETAQFVADIRKRHGGVVMGFA